MQTEYNCKKAAIAKEGTVVQLGTVAKTEGRYWSGRRYYNGGGAIAMGRGYGSGGGAAAEEAMAMEAGLSWWGRAVVLGQASHWQIP